MSDLNTEAQRHREGCARSPRRMRDSGVEWLGVVPEEWPVERLQWRLAEIVVKNDPIKTDNVLSLTIDRGVIPYSEKGNVGNKSKEDLSQYKVAYVDTIVANSMNILIGAVGLSKYEGCVSPVYYVFRAKEGNSIKYFGYLFQMPSFQKELRRFANGILEIRLRVSADDILKRQLAIPPLAEQRAIAAYLDERCAKIDAMVADAKKLIEEYKAWKASLIFEAVTGKREVMSEELRVKSELRDAGVEWIGAVPEGWRIGCLFQQVRQVKCLNEGLVEKNLLSLSYGKIKRRNIDAVGGLLPASFEGYNRIEPGDIVLRLTDLQNDQHSLRTGLSHEKGIVTSAYLTVRPADGSNSAYLHYALYGFDVVKGFYGMGAGVRQGLTYGDVKLLKLPIPPLDEQRAIAAYLDRKCAAIDRVVAEKEGLIADLEQYKKSLIFECVTGKRELA